MRSMGTMTFYADLHVHSKHSRATSANCDLEHLAIWAAKKGIGVVATGDFTHPVWRQELNDKLVPAGPGLYRLRPDIERELSRSIPAGCAAAGTLPQFMLSVEISTIYKKDERTRKVHHLVYVPDLATAEVVSARLGRIGNVSSDGRPILGLDSRDLLEVTLEAGEGCYLVPAHIWTPWFSALGARSGFDAIEDCYGDLSKHIFAVETGLSSDPAMNARVSKLDRYRLVSNSDAHSPQRLGREVCVFETGTDYWAMKAALETGAGYWGTLEANAETGKYYTDGHRACAVRLSPSESRMREGKCPACGQPLTMGVLHRVEDLADREHARELESRSRSLVPLPEILGEIQDSGAKSAAVLREYERLLARAGPELTLLNASEPEELRKAGGTLLEEAILRMRRGEVTCEPGYDGIYGKVRLFSADELRERTRGRGLFSDTVDEAAQPQTSEEGQHAGPCEPAQRQNEVQARRDTGELDGEQHRAAQWLGGPVLIEAGPGTGKTRIIAHRAAAIATHAQGPCLAVTFTNKARRELRERIDRTLGGETGTIEVHTFHSLALAIVTANRASAGLQRGFAIASEAHRAQILKNATGMTGKEVAKALERIAAMKRGGGIGDDTVANAYQDAMEQGNSIDFDDLIHKATVVLEERAAGSRYRHVLVDEYQDTDEAQVRMLKALCGPGTVICAIGDPDQSIYGFRGASPERFRRFADTFGEPERVKLVRNYRSSGAVKGAAETIMGRWHAQGMKGAGIRIREEDTARGEARGIAGEIVRLMGGDNLLSIDRGLADASREGQLGFADFAVLARTRAQCVEIGKVIEEAGLPVYTRSHEALRDNAKVARAMSCMAAMEGSAAERIGALAEAQQRDAVEGAEWLSGLLAGRSWSFERLEQETATATEADTLDPRAERVAVLTMHASKGLEFEVVFVAGVEEGIVPLERPGEARTEEQTDEERRLLYVAATRARSRLYLSWARKRRLWGAKLQGKPSRWLEGARRSERRQGEREAQQLAMFE